MMLAQVWNKVLRLLGSLSGTAVSIICGQLHEPDILLDILQISYLIFMSCKGPFIIHIL